jgi:aryl-alcohol dehydrogenase-like predicted oxidoreductase
VHGAHLRRGHAVSFYYQHRDDLETPLEETVATLGDLIRAGKYAPGGKPHSDTRAGRSDRRMLEAEFREQSLQHAQRIKAQAEKRGMTAGQFALNWVLNNRLVTAVIAGPRTEDQWHGYLGTLEHQFDAAHEALSDSLVAPEHTSTPGYTDPKFPILGRVPRA